jgi:hypothetical protein
MHICTTVCTYIHKFFMDLSTIENLPNEVALLHYFHNSYTQFGKANEVEVWDVKSMENISHHAPM